jgi:hypothetical protein
MTSGGNQDRMKRALLAAAVLALVVWLILLIRTLGFGTGS